MPKILFNKAGDGIAELRPYLVNLYASDEFDNIKEFIVDATDMLIREIGQAVYTLAIDHYESENFGSEDTQDFERLNELVRYCQKPLALFAYLEYAPVNDIKDDGNGRRMHVDEHSKMPFDWVLDRQELKIFHRAHRAMDNLFNFLNKEVEHFPEWKESGTYIAQTKLIIFTAEELQKIIPIDGSSWFFYKTLSFNEQIQKNVIRPVLSPAVHDDLVSHLHNTSEEDLLTEHEKDILPEIRNTIGLSIMAMAFRRLPIKIIPQGLVQEYTSDRAGSAASKTPAANEKIEAAQEFEKGAMRELTALKEKLRKHKLTLQGETYPEVKEEPDYDNLKHFRA